MKNIQDLIEKYNMSEYQVTRFTGQPSRSDALRCVASGEREPTSINLNLLTSYARGLGLRLQDLLDDFELDGTSSQVISINKYVDKLKRLNEEIEEHDNGYIISNGMDKEGYKLKTKYEFLNPKLSHSSQPTNDIYLLNRTYLDVILEQEKNNNTLAQLRPRYSKRVKSVMIYSKLPNGGDLKLVGYSYDNKGNLLFSQIVGCEWIDQDDNKSICYYKAHSNKEINPKDVNRIDKEEMSELEFYQSLHHQFPLYNVVQ